MTRRRAAMRLRDAPLATRHRRSAGEEARHAGERDGFEMLVGIGGACCTGRALALGVDA